MTDFREVPEEVCSSCDKELEFDEVVYCRRCQKPYCERCVCDCEEEEGERLMTQEEAEKYFEGGVEFTHENIAKVHEIVDKLLPMEDLINDLNQRLESSWEAPIEYDFAAENATPVWRNAEDLNLEEIATLIDNITMDYYETPAENIAERGLLYKVYQSLARYYNKKVGKQVISENL